MNILEYLFCYWAISFPIIFFLYVDMDVDSEKLGIKHFIKTLLISILLGWILLPIELVRMLKNN